MRFGRMSSSRVATISLSRSSVREKSKAGAVKLSSCQSQKDIPQPQSSRDLVAAKVEPRKGRAKSDLRVVTLERSVAPYAEGSCLATFGLTRVLCTATVEEGVPGWRRGRGEGWLTAEYAMLPRATRTRTY